MSHDINFTNGKFSFFAATGKHGMPWHGLGQLVRDAQSWQEAMKLAGLDWQVTKEALFSKEGNELPTFGIFRADNREFLGSVGSKYTPIQNQYAFDFVDALLGAENGAHYESAGALGNGERIWCLARIPHDITIKGTDDTSKSFLLFTSSHDGSMSALSKITSVRVVCNNTLTQALSIKTGAALRIRHTNSANVKLDEAKRILNGVRADINTLAEKLNHLASRKVTKTTFMAIIDKLFPNDDKGEKSKRAINQIEKISELFASNDNNAFPSIKGSAYNLLNACTEYTDHFRSVRGVDGRESVEIVRAESSLFGTGEEWKQKALDSILELTANDPAMPAAPVYSIPSGTSKVDSILSSINVN